ncbi:MAG TPA: DUF2007 domain-containing protein [Thermomicrobiales bacterium]|nr:DUF2007 domain-containing protein [Thermomicrobiales bacterium]
MSDVDLPDGSRVVEIAVAPNELTADMWRQALEDDGIIAALKPGGVGFSFGSSALMEHYILVREDQAERARAIISELESSDEDDESWSSSS